jgi:gamma-glutamyltranspeptidase
MVSAERGQALDVPGAIADFAHHAARRVARAPDHDDQIIEPARRLARTAHLSVRQRGREKDQRQHDRHQEHPARRQFQPQIALEFRVHDDPCPTCLK